MRDFVLAMLLLPVGLALFGCPAAARPPNPIEQCTALCQSEAGKACSESECARGCELVLDRIVERETKGIVACVGKSRRRCSDTAWAECASLVGPHADGGPPALPPPDPFDE
jgi:hypothetical protein